VNLTLRVWRQASPSARGGFVVYKATNVSPDMSFLEMLDVVNEELTARGTFRLRSTMIAVRASAARAG
jgi:succinate dehydrogenase / fumarate reductase, iron-sulfur subunit